MSGAALLLTALVVFVLGYALGVASTNRRLQAERRILSELDFSGVQSALAISKRTGIGIGSVYVHLAHLEDERRVESVWENINPVAEGRPRRRFYRLVVH